MKTKCPHLTCHLTLQIWPYGLVLVAAITLLMLLGCLGPVLAQTVPTPDWLRKTLTNPPQVAPPTNKPPEQPATSAVPAGAARTTSQQVGGLSEQDVAMANAVIAENTLTLNLPGLGTSVDSPGPLTGADRLVLLALKFYHQRKVLVPFGEMRQRLQALESSERYRRVAEEYWAWYREVAQQGNVAQLGGYKSEFSTYIAMKNTARRKAANRVLAGQVASEAAWRRAMESDQKTRDRSLQRADSAQKAREERLRDWSVHAADAAAAEKEWQLYLSHGAGHMISQ
jgi:hypothetical protein